MPFCDHWYAYPEPALAVRTTLFPWQKVVGPDGVIVAKRLLFIVTAVALVVYVHEPFVIITL